MTDRKQKPADFKGLIWDTGAGGEVHQHAKGDGDRLNTAQGVVIADNHNSLRVGAPGPTLMEDFAMREIFHFDITDAAAVASRPTMDDACVQQMHRLAGSARESFCETAAHAEIETALAQALKKVSGSR